MFVHNNNSDNSSGSGLLTTTTPKQLMEQIMDPKKDPFHDGLFKSNNDLLAHAVCKCAEQVTMGDTQHQEWLEVCEHILKHLPGINLSEEPIFVDDFRESSILSISIEANDLKLVELLLSNGADPNFLCGFKYRDNMINYAISSKSMEILQLLFKYGADVNWCKKGHAGRFSSLNYAYVHGEFEMLNYLLSIPHVSLRESRLFHTASEKGDVNMVKRLITNHLDTLDVNLGNLSTPLYEACKKQHAEIVKLLVNLPGIDINLGYLSDRPITPLYEAIQKSNREIVSILIANGAILTAQDNRWALKLMGINLYQLKFESQPVSNFQKKLFARKNQIRLSDITIVNM